MNASPAPTVSTTSIGSRRHAHERSADQGPGAVAAERDDGHRRPEPGPAGQHLVDRVAGIEPGDVLVTGLDQVAEGDELLDARTLVMGVAQQRRPQVGVEGDRRVVARLARRSAGPGRRPAAGPCRSSRCAGGRRRPARATRAGPRLRSKVYVATPRVVQPVRSPSACGRPRPSRRRTWTPSRSRCSRICSPRGVRRRCGWPARPRGRAGPGRGRRWPGCPRRARALVPSGETTMSTSASPTTRVSWPSRDGPAAIEGPPGRGCPAGRPGTRHARRCRR